MTIAQEVLQLDPNGSALGWIDRSLYPFQSRYLTIDGNQIHYVDEGNGPILLLMAGQPVWSFLYRRFIQALRNDFRCIAIDLPGSVLSPKADSYTISLANHSAMVEQCIERLQLTDITLLAHGFAGPITLGVVTRQPKRFRGVILNNTFGFRLKGQIPKTYRMVKMMGSLIPGRLMVVYLNALPQFLASGIRGGLSSVEKAMYAKAFQRKDRHNITNLFKDLTTLGAHAYLSELEQQLPHLDLPVLLLWGENDNGHTWGHTAKFQQLFGEHVQTVLVPDSAHFTPEDDPDTMIDALRQWHATLSSSSPEKFRTTSQTEWMEQNFSG